MFRCHNFFFFFSSRRRHTRYIGDWSSDVCSSVLFVSGNYFTMFGVGPYAGRTLMPADDQAGAAPVAVMSYRLWREAYGSDSAVIGTVFNLNDKPFTIVGITPPSFFGDSLRKIPPDFFLPLMTEPYLEAD